MGKARVGRAATGEDPSVYDYTDFRLFLKAYYEGQKKSNPAFSYRYFALRAKINSSGLFKNVVDGKRSLGRGLIVRFAEAMRLGKKEAEYFENLVHFNEAATIEEKRIFFERMLALRKPDTVLLHAGQFEFYSRWYYTAVRELIGIIPCKGDFAALGRALNPPIRPDQAEKAIKVLESLGLIARDADGRYRQTQAQLTTGPEVASLQVANYQVACMELAKDAIDRHDPDVRDLSTLTLSLSAAGFEAFKEEIVSFRKKLLAMERKFPGPDRIYQLNTQFFPLSALPAKGKP